MDEAFFSGYCRCMDAPRMVAVERDGGEVTVDCEFFCCPYADRCTVAAQIRQFEEK